MHAMDDLIAEQIPRLRRYARALTRQSARADDLVQDTLERSWARRHLWRPGTDLRAWMFTIMHNLFVNQMRRREPEPLDDERLEVPTPGDQEARLAQRDLERALARLPAEFREVLVLVAVEQMRYEEVATVLDVPIGTVMSRLARARERLRVLMNGDEAPTLRRVK